MRFYRLTQAEPRRQIGRFVAVGAVAIVVGACGVSPAERTGAGEPTASTGSTSIADSSVSLRMVPSPAIPATAREIPNPLRGQYEDLMQPLFPQGNTAQHSYPDWPPSFDAGMRVSWRQLQPTDPHTLAPDTPDDAKYDFSVIDNALQQVGARGMRLMLRVSAYNSCCNAAYPNNTNISIPDWLRSIPGAATTFPTPDSGVRQVVPNWNSPAYLAGFEELLAALGRRYDGDERLSVFEFSGYGDFSENHNSFLLTVLHVAGPAPEDSQHELGYFSQWRDQSIKIGSIKRLVAANVGAFRRTQLVVTPQNPEIVRQLFADPVAAELVAPVGIRSDCLGVDDPVPGWAHAADSHYVTTNDPLVDQLTQRLSSAPVITEWCGLFPTGPDRRRYYEKGLHDVVAYHVSMTSSINFPDRDADAQMEPELFALWSRANAFAGYRYSVEGIDGSVVGAVASLEAKWSNYGSAATTEKWTAGYRLV